MKEPQITKYASVAELGITDDMEIFRASSPLGKNAGPGTRGYGWRAEWNGHVGYFPSEPDPDYIRELYAEPKRQ